jgi:uncharacterized membrane protein
MQAKIKTVWDSLVSSYWFLPGTMVALAVGLSFLTLWIDERRGELNEVWRYGGGVSGARSVLETIAGSMITVAGVTFSITFVALSVMASKFGPRLLKTFMRDKGNQIVLGTFLATFMYCLLVLQEARGTDETVEAPVSVTAAVVLGAASVAVLIYFIHHVSRLLQLNHVIANVAQDLNKVIDEVFPAKGTGERRRPEKNALQRFERGGEVVRSSQDAYVQSIDVAVLLRIAERQELTMRVEQRPGDFVIRGNPLLRVWPGDRLDERLARKLREAFTFGIERTHVQDVEFAITQLVEVAVRALSPGVNEPFTAISCLDRLGAALCRIAEREMPSAYLYDGEGRLRIVKRALTYHGIVEAAFDQIRQNVYSEAAVAIRMLEVIAMAPESTAVPEFRNTLLQEARMTWEGARESLRQEKDRRDLEERYRKLVQMLATTDRSAV